MKNFLRLLAMKQTTEPLESDYVTPGDARADLDEADRALETELNRLASYGAEWERSITDKANDVRSNALFEGYEAGMRMGARLVYELLLKEGSIA